MFLIGPLVLVVVLVGVLVAAATALRGLRGLLVAVGLAPLVILLVATAAVIALGLSRGSGGEDPINGEVEVSEPSQDHDDDPEGAGRSDLEPAFVRGGPGLQIGPGLGDLAETTVLDLRISGFTPDSTGRLEQCIAVEEQIRACEGGYPVRFDISGRARVQYRVTPSVRGTECGGEAGCVALVSDSATRQRGVVPLAFGEPLADPPPISRIPAPIRPSEPVVRPSYEATHLALGLAVSLLLLAAATVIIRRTDWTASDEIETPELDGAELL